MSDMSEHRLMPNMLRVLNGNRALADQVIAEVEDSLWLSEQIAQAKAEAIKEIADHLATPNVLYHGDSGVTVYESEDDFYTGSQRPQPIVDWLRARAAGEVDSGRD